MSRLGVFFLSNRQKRRLTKNLGDDKIFTDNSSKLLKVVKGVSSSSANISSAAGSSSQIISDTVTVSELCDVTPPTFPLEFESNNVIDCDLADSLCDFDYELDDNVGSYKLDSSESDQEYFNSSDFEIDFKYKLQKWSLDNNISHSATSDLLKLLKTHSCLSYLPSDARTLLHTPTKTVLREVLPGNYCHFGLEVGIQRILVRRKWEGKVCVQINIDGLPISTSDKKEWWPILAHIRGTSTSNIIVVGIYEGKTKPINLNNYIGEFVEEALRLYRDGVDLNTVKFPFEIEAFVCDAPARAFVCQIKNHTGYYGCGKCTLKGKYVENRVVFIKTDASVRTDQSFRDKLQPKHHNGDSAVEKLPIDIIKSFPYEYMHLVCLGVTKKLIKLWAVGKIRVFRLAPRVAAKISKKLVKLGSCLPLEFNRKQRPLGEIDRWKATELRTFLLYTGSIALKKYLPENHYQLFMSLSVAINILVNPKIQDELLSYADSLLRYFVDQFKKIYGRVNMLYNIHGLIHLADDVRAFGSLDKFSAFKFENKLGQIKKLIRKPSSSLVQVHHRLAEQNLLDFDDEKLKNHEYPVFSRSAADGSYKLQNLKPTLLSAI